jgi:hypothetical protein
MFVVNNVVHCLDQQEWFVELLLANKYGRKDNLHVSKFHYGLVHEPRHASGSTAIDKDKMLLVIISQKASVGIAPFELAFLFKLA